MRNQQAIEQLSAEIRQRYGRAIDSIIVFGSVATSTDTDESDIDIMVVFNSGDLNIDWRLEREIRSMAMAVELEHDVVFDLKVREKSECEGLKGHTPFAEHVLSEGIRV